MISVLSSSYDSIKTTGLYSEDLVYDKRIPNENRDMVIAQALTYFNLDYILDNMDYETLVTVQGFFCHAFIATYCVLLIMICTRQPGTINLSGQRRLLTKFFSFLIVTTAKTLQLPLITFMLKIFACKNEEIYFDSIQSAVETAEAKAAASASNASQNSGNN